MDIGTYCVSGVRLLAGEPESVYGEQVLGGGGVDVRFSGLMSFESGVRGLFYCSFESPPRKALEAVGSEGVLTLHDPWHSWRGGIELQRAEEDGSEPIEVEPGDAYLLELEDFARAIRGEKGAAARLRRRPRAVTGARGPLPFGRRGKAGRPLEAGSGSLTARDRRVRS